MKYRIIADGEVISQDSESLRSDGKWEKTPEPLVGMIFDKKNNPDWYFRVEEDEDEM
jgi:hypothetical protein